MDYSCPLKAQMLCDKASHHWAVKHPEKTHVSTLKPRRKHKKIKSQETSATINFIVKCIINRLELTLWTKLPQTVQRPFQECSVPLRIRGHYTEERMCSVCFTLYSGHECKGATCEATHYAHPMISGNVGIAVMPRENPITPSMRTSNHSRLHTRTNKNRNKADNKCSSRNVVVFL